MYVHHVWCRLYRHRFQMPVAIAETNDAPLIFGRVGALERFTATFLKDRETRLQ